MKKIHAIKKYTLLATIALLIANCTDFEDAEYFSGFSCSDCYNPEPDSADLIINLTIDSENQEVPLTVYKGEVEDGNIIFSDTVSNNKIYVYTETDEFYSAVAHYTVDEKKIHAYDGSKMITRAHYDECDVECWTIHGGRLDMKLKEY